MKKKIIFVFGTRPEAIKMAPLVAEVKKYPRRYSCSVVVTAQHREMLDQVLKIFSIRPDHDLNLMAPNQSVTDIVSKSLVGLERVIKQEKPDLVLVQGDTSTAFAASLSAFYHRVLLGHVEAGLRTFDKWRPYPEEMNRKLTTLLADLHFAPTPRSVKHLLAEKVSRDSIYLTGNTVIDALLQVAERPYRLERIGLRLNPAKRLLLLTAHRRESFGEPMRQICRAVKKLVNKYASDIEVVVPVHRNPQVRSAVKEILGDLPVVKLIDPLEYEPFVHLMKAAYLILTDSGGVQEEAPSLGKPVLVLREKTERPEAIESGGVKLVGVKENVIFSSADKLMASDAEYDKMVKVVNPYGDGKACRRIIGALDYHFGFKKSKPKEFRCAGS